MRLIPPYLTWIRVGYGNGLVRGVRISVHFTWQNLAQIDVLEKLYEIPCRNGLQGKSNHNKVKVASIPLEQGNFGFQRIVLRSFLLVGKKDKSHPNCLDGWSHRDRVVQHVQGSPCWRGWVPQP